VITPAYNAASYIAAAVESVLAQTYREFEYIIVDDCSTDGTYEIIARYAEQYGCIKVVRNSVNLGIAGSRNRGLSLARGKYVMWQDADDVSLPYRMKEQVDLLERNPDVGIVGGGLRFFGHEGENRQRHYLTDDAAMRKIIFRYSPVAQPAAMVRKSVLDRCGEYRYPPTEDLDMLFRIGRISKFANLNKIVLNYRESPTSATYSRLRLMERNTLRIRMRNLWRGYSISSLDLLFNVLHMAALYLVPARTKLWLFSRLRDRRI
jgi:glycosyltransferase involved in cell wall biosynthesis